MYTDMTCRTGDERLLAREFLRKCDYRLLDFDVGDLDPQQISEDDVLAVHFADAGAQGDAGAVELLCRSPQGTRILYGNYAYGTLDLDGVISRLPMLRSLDSRRAVKPPYPFGGTLVVPDEWGYMYMGAMNHLFVRKPIRDRTKDFIAALSVEGGHSSQVFDAVAWFCMARQNP